MRFREFLGIAGMLCGLLGAAAAASADPTLVDDNFVRVGSSETLTAPFTIPATPTVNTYGGLVEVIVSGTGFSLFSRINDAFYGSSGSPLDSQYYQLNIGWDGFVLQPLSGEPHNINNFIVFIDGMGEVAPPATPPFDGASHTYRFVLLLPVDAGTLTFGVSDGNFSDNGGQYDIQVFQVEAKPPVSATMTPIQAVRNTVSEDLIAGKRGVVRVVPQIDRSNDAPQPVMAELCVTDVDPTCQLKVTATGTAYPFDHVFSESDRLNGEDSIDLEFRALLATRLTAGSHTFEVTVSSTTGAFDDIVLTRTLKFRQSKTMGIFTFPYGVAEFGGSPVFPGDSNLWASDRLLRAVYPIDEDLVTNRIMALDAYVPPNSNPIFSLSSIGGRASVGGSIMRRIKTALLHSHRDFSLKYGVGVLPLLDGGESPLGDGTLGVSLSRPKGVVLIVEKDAAGKSLIPFAAAHEIGHQLGMGEEYCFPESDFPCAGSPTNLPPQVPLAGDSTGNFIRESMLAYDTGGFYTLRDRLFHTATDGLYGYMGASDTTVSYWTTSSEYGYLFGKLTLPPAGFAPQVASLDTAAVEPAAVQAAAVAPREVIYVSGIVGTDGSASLDPFAVAETGVELPPLEGSGYRVEFRDGAGMTLGQAEFGIDFAIEVFSATGTRVEDADMAPFGILAELPPGTDNVSLWAGASELASVDRSFATPVVDITGIRVASDGAVDVAWAGSDGDGDPIDYSLVYSEDGAALNSVVTGIADSSFAFVPAGIGGGAPAPGTFVRVIASDGFNFSQTEASLDYGGSADAVLLKQYNTRGPNLPGMCARRGCVADKRHTLVAKNLLAGETVLADYEIIVDSVPAAGCTVNGAAPRAAIAVARDVALQPGGQARRDVDLQFACPVDGAAIDQNFVLRARVRTTDGFDMAPANNDIVDTQTVR